MASSCEVRLTSVVAGPGFGKTSLLRTYLSPTDSTTMRRVWLTCEPLDRDGEHLLAGLAVAVGLPAGADAEAVCDRVWTWAPRPAVLVLDDVHEVPRGCSGAEVLRTLVADLPANAHVVLASRTALPIDTARLAASGQLLRVREADLVLDEDELATFAHDRGIDRGLLAGTGGWAALAELTATAGADLVYDYLWEEVLERIGADRARRLAAFALVGGGGDQIATAVVGDDQDVDSLVEGVPLVQRSADATTLHPLWEPTLRRLLTRDEVAGAQRAAAEAHRRADALANAVDLYAEAEAWPDVLAVMRDAAVRVPADRGPRLLPEVEPAVFGRWHALLPQAWRDAPAARLAVAIAGRSADPRAALPDIDAAIEGFAEVGDADGEAAAIASKSLVLTWTNDLAGLRAVGPRIAELARAGSQIARTLRLIGRALVAHLMGDSATVHATLGAIDPRTAPGWEPVLGWFEAVAFRRDGDLDRAIAVADEARAAGDGVHRLHLDQATARARWLRGDVDDACAALEDLERGFRDSGDHFNASGARLELATRRAWLGEPETGERLLRSLGGGRDAVTGPMMEVMTAMARAAVLVAQGRETAAADALRAAAVATVGEPEGWYWQDRGATALVHVLVPETRAAWGQLELPDCHAAALALATSLEAARAGDVRHLTTMTWPDAPTLIAALPLTWIAELATAAAAAGNPPAPETAAALGDRFTTELERHQARQPTPARGTLLDAIPAAPPYHLRVEVLGSLRLSRDSVAVNAPQLRRQRVRELLAFLVAHPRVRREQAAAAIWPDLDDGGRNLRVTMTYLQQLVQPDRGDRAAPYFLRSEGRWLVLDTSEGRLTTDLWDLRRALDTGHDHDRAGRPRDAISSYRSAVELWRGEPFADQPYSEWAVAARRELTVSFTRAARRLSELLVAAGDDDAARRAIDVALRADPDDPETLAAQARA